MHSQQLLPRQQHPSHPAPLRRGAVPTALSAVHGPAGHFPRPSLLTLISLLCLPGPGTSVMQVMASDADDPTYGSSARVVYSVLDGEQHFTVDSKTG